MKMRKKLMLAAGVLVALLVWHFSLSAAPLLLF